MTSADDFTTRQAAQYCGLTRSGFIRNRQHGLVLPDYRIGNMMMFTKQTLDRFNSNRRGAGRPRKSQQAQEATG
jgi:hypothetical protein